VSGVGVRVLPNRTNSNRPSDRVRKGPHARSILIWQFLFGSLFLDPIIPILITPQLPIDVATSIAILCAIAVLPFLGQRTLHKILSSLRHIHSKSLTVGSKALPFSLALSATVVILLKVLMFSHLPRGFLVAILVVMVWGSRKFITQVGKQTEQDKKLFSSNPWAKVQRWEHQVLVFAVLPLVLARIISVCGAFAVLMPEQEEVRIDFIVISALFLGMLKPDRSFFIGTCKKCQRPVPIVFQDIGSCLTCDANLRIAYHAWVYNIAPTHLERDTPPADAVEKD
jgi:hypothetical protein